MSASSAKLIDQSSFAAAVVKIAFALKLLSFFGFQFASMASISASGGHAFDKLIPSASTSVASSSGAKHLPYDVFINHRGKDVKPLAGSIYSALDATGLRIFLDNEELKEGDFFPRVIEDAITGASLHIAIVSQHYAESPWCLAELAFMVETGKTIIPVFYYVKPSDLRWAIEGKGIYADAFCEHEKKNRYTSEELQRWKLTLQQVSCCYGAIVENIDDEPRVLKDVVNRVMKEMNKVPLEVAKHPVGLVKAEQDFDAIALESVGPIKIVGIWGMGGSGKTTLAKELYNKKCSIVDRSSFLSDLREAARKGSLHEKQKKLLEDLDLKCKRSTFDNVEEGKEVLKNRLRSVSVLIVLDDVDHTDQLDALLPARDSLGHGSLIIVTTRDKHVLIAWGISAIYKMKAMSNIHAEQLFCWHAFLRPSPLLGFEDLVKKFINACHGLPLSLKVLGGHLYGELNKDYWQAQLDKLSRILPDDIKLRFRLSYDALDKEEKEMFLDISCFFIGWRNSWAIAVWDGSGWNGLHGWQSLLNRCLVEVDEKNCIRVHDHLRDLGREIANQWSPYRLWYRGQVIEIQPQQEGLRIRGIVNATGDSCYSSQGNIIIYTSQGSRAFKSCSVGLKIIVGTGHFFSQENEKLLKELVWLRCYRFQHSDIPSWLSMQNLRILQLFSCGNLTDLWDAEANAPLQLRELIIKNCRLFRGFPESIGRLLHLKEIKVKSSEISSLPREFCLLQSLEVLKLSRCRNFSSLPSDFGKLSRLQHLDLSYCSQLRSLPVSFKQLKLLQYLNLEECFELIVELDILEDMTMLKYLNFNGCSKLKKLPLPSGASLTELHLERTNLEELQDKIGQLSNLTALEISSDLLTALPSSIGNLSSLYSLKIKKCQRLKYLPASLKNLSSLISLRISLCPNLESLPDSLGCLNLLEDLWISCSNVTCLPKSITNGSELSFGPSRIKKIQITYTKVSEISISGDCCPCLATLLLKRNRHLKAVRTLPRAVETLKVDNCEVLEDIGGICDLGKLHTMIVRRCSKLYRLPSFSKLVALKDLELPGHLKKTKVEGLDCQVVWGH